MRLKITTYSFIAIFLFILSGIVIDTLIDYTKITTSDIVTSIAIDDAIIFKLIELFILLYMVYLLIEKSYTVYTNTIKQEYIKNNFRDIAEELRNNTVKKQTLNTDIKDDSNGITTDDFVEPEDSLRNNLLCLLNKIKLDYKKRNIVKVNEYDEADNNLLIDKLFSRHINFLENNDVTVNVNLLMFFIEKPFYFNMLYSHVKNLEIFIEQIPNSHVRYLCNQVDLIIKIAIKDSINYNIVGLPAYVNKKVVIEGCKILANGCKDVD
jgi:hypothetical protein